MTSARHLSVLLVSSTITRRANKRKRIKRKNKIRNWNKQSLLENFNAIYVHSTLMCVCVDACACVNESFKNPNKIFRVSIEHKYC